MILEIYDKLTFSEMAEQDLKALPHNETLAERLNDLNNMSAHIMTDTPRDGVNFTWQAMGMFGGLIAKDGKYDLYS